MNGKGNGFGGFAGLPGLERTDAAHSCRYFESVVNQTMFFYWNNGSCTANVEYPILGSKTRQSVNSA